jgi:hypothetical protein
MGTLGTGNRHSRAGWTGRVHAIPWLYVDNHPLVAKQVDAGTSMNPATPVISEERSRADGHWMQQHAHLARLCCRTAIPLTLLA